MKIHIISSTAALVAVWSATAVAMDLQLISTIRTVTDHGQTAPANLEVDSVHTTGGSCDSCDAGFGNGNCLETCGPDCAYGARCERKNRYFLDVESTYFRYHRADGVRLDGSNSDSGVEFGFKNSPRSQPDSTTATRLESSPAGGNTTMPNRHPTQISVIWASIRTISTSSSWT